MMHGYSPVPLENRCRRDISARDRERGYTYFRQGRVRLSHLLPTAALAVVEGTEDYFVAVEGEAADRGILQVMCSCPRFEDGDTCKHVWATVLTMDAEDESWRIRGVNDLRFDIDTLFEMDFFDEPGVSAKILASVERAPAPPRPNWQVQLKEVDRRVSDFRSLGAAPRDTKKREIIYQLDIDASLSRAELTVAFLQHQRKKNGQWGKMKYLAVAAPDLDLFPAGEDRDLLRFLIATAPQQSWRRGYGAPYKQDSATLSESVYEYVLPRLCATGRFRWVRAGSKPEFGATLAWDDGPPWTLALEVTWGADKRELHITGFLERPAHKLPLSEPLLLLRSGLVVFTDRVARFEIEPHFPWVTLLRRENTVTVPARDQAELVEALWSSSELPSLALPPDLELEEIPVTPVPWVRFRSVGQRLGAEIFFDYDGERIPTTHERRGWVRGRTVVVRDRAWEARKLDELYELGLRPFDDPSAVHTLQLPPKQLPTVTAHLLEKGWAVEAEGLRVRRPGAASFSVTSGIDWLDLEGGLDFDVEIVTIPDVLRALERGESFVRLSDGSHGMLPEEWLARSGALAELSPKREGTALRFSMSQALLLDALLQEDENVQVDRAFEKLRERLRSFTGIEPAPEPRGFRGTLRPYQREGLAWLSFLSEFGFGGCLADDMGLGKTIQVLALLQLRKLRRRGKRKSSLLIVPRSLVHNWIEEAARFVPRLSVLDYSGAQRAKRAGNLSEADAVVTTYGVLRRDILSLKETDFDYVILDEAQAVKNERSQSAKCCRLLRSDHRLALSGTPVENHLGELFSIFQFLNPGMLGRLGRNGRQSRGSSPLIEAASIAPALRPFILRRTKEQVLPDLPAKSEQTVYCVLERPQRKLYEELRRHYQASLSKHIEKVGLARSKIQVLEALLRLRQAACHPGLLDPDRSEEKAAKLEVLLEQIAQVVEEGHKALVFSQFTRFLAIVRRRLDQKKIVYEYLDGRTRNRKARVDRFQTDPDCPLFLVSLKAGGLGLNLTAADYVFLLDPWWNPATESQAIDRTHRIGQTRPVFAYRLIVEDTVEEKILLLQDKKRALADAIISENHSLVRNLTASDLKMLLS